MDVGSSILAASFEEIFTAKIVPMAEYALAAVVGDWAISCIPRTETFLLFQEYIEFVVIAKLLKDHLPRILNKPMRTYGWQEILITTALGTAMKSASHLGTRYLSALLSPPKTLWHYALVELVLLGVVSPTFNYFNFDGTDEVNFTLFIQGLVEIASFVSVSCFIKHWLIICISVRGQALRSTSIDILRHGVIGVILLFSFVISVLFLSFIISDHRNARVKEKALSAVYYLVRMSVAAFLKYLALLQPIGGIFDWFDSWVAAKVHTQYTYVPLQGSRQARLLRLRRRKLFTALRCELVHFNIDDPPVYKAISYTWGVGETATVNINIIGEEGKMHELKVTPAVYDILSYRQTFLGSQNFFIDAACINQKDEVERGQQVRLMRNIYKQAHRVVVWLGPIAEGKDATLARGLLHSLTVRKDILFATPEELYEMVIRNNNPGWEALRKMFAHRWFSRVWVLQEVAIATTVHVMYGRTCTSWDRFAAASEIITLPQLFGAALRPRSHELILEAENKPSSKPMWAHAVENVANLKLMATLRSHVLASQPMCLGDALYWGSRLHSSDPRDKIYGLLGMVTEDLPKDVMPDYTKTAENLYIDTMRYLVSQPDRSYIVHPMYNAGIGFLRTPDMIKADLPSWVVDWSSPNLGRLAPGFLHLLNSENTGTGWTKEMFTEDPRIIRIYAAAVDKIKLCSSLVLKANDPSAFSTSPGDFNDHLLAWKDDAWELMEKSSYGLYKNQEIFEEAFWRTLMGPTEPGHAPISSSDWKDWKILSAANDWKANDIYGSERLAIGARLERMLYAVGAQCGGKRFCITESGSPGLLPPHVKKNDRICYIQGLKLPFLLRKEITKNVDPVRYALVGVCYIDILRDSRGLHKQNLKWEMMYLE